MNYNLISIDGLITVPLMHITPHERYDRFAELLAATDYLQPSAHALQNDALAYCLLTHPILVIKAKRNKDQYLCIGGIRSFLLAQSNYSTEEQLTVIQITRPDIDIIEKLINTDILVSPMLYSLRSPKSIGTVYQSLTREEIDKIFKQKMGSKSALAKNMGIALNTLFPPPEKRGK